MAVLTTPVHNRTVHEKVVQHQVPQVPERHQQNQKVLQDYHHLGHLQAVVHQDHRHHHVYPDQDRRHQVLDYLQNLQEHIYHHQKVEHHPVQPPQVHQVQARLEHLPAHLVQDLVVPVVQVLVQVVAEVLVQVPVLQAQNRDQKNNFKISGFSVFAQCRTITEPASLPPDNNTNQLEASR